MANRIPDRLALAAFAVVVLMGSARAQTPTEPSSTSERKLFDFPAAAGGSPVFYNVTRFSWVDETTILATVRQPSDLQVRLVNIATGESRDVGQGGCAALSPDHARVAWVRGPGLIATGDVWILDLRSIEVRSIEFTYLDLQSPPGRHTYQIYIPSKFLSSPLLFDVFPGMT